MQSFKICHFREKPSILLFSRSIHNLLSISWFLVIVVLCLINIKICSPKIQSVWFVLHKTQECSGLWWYIKHRSGVVCGAGCSGAGTAGRCRVINWPRPTTWRPCQTHQKQHHRAGKPTEVCTTTGLVFGICETCSFSQKHSATQLLCSKTLRLF